jgi:hypothetical protein
MRNLLLILCAALLTSGFVILPGDFISELKNKFRIFQQANTPVTLDLTFHQPKYAPGDSVFFRTLYFETGSGTAVSGKHIVNLTLQDDAGSPVMFYQYAVQDGYGGHRFALPADLKPGNYKVGAYTRWMRNFDEGLFFTCDLQIAGSRLLVEDDDAAGLVKFYPEGGSIIAGVENNVLVQVPPDRGNQTGYIRADDATISGISFDEKGFGRARFVAKESEKYHLEIGTNAGAKRFALPVVSTEGFALDVRKGNNRNLIVDVRPSEKIRAVQQRFFLLVTDANGSFFGQELDLASKEPLQLTIPSRGIKGRATISIISEDSRTWATRVMSASLEEERIVTDFSKAKSAYNTREEVKIDVTVQDESGNPISGQFAVRVINHDLFNTTSDGLSDPHNEDDVLLAQKTWVDWKKIIDGSKPVFAPQKYVVVAGTATSSETEKPVPDSTLISFFFEKDVFGYEVYTNRNGEFAFPILYDFRGDQEVFYWASYKGKDAGGIKIALKKTEVAGSPAAAKLVASSQPDAYGLFAAKKQLVDQSYSFYTVDRATARGQHSNSLIEEELGGADVVVDLNNYVVFPTMAEVIREVLPSVEHRRTGEVDVIRVYTSHKRASKFAQPIYVIDGRVTKDTKIFLGLNPQQVNTIKIIREGNKLIRLGSLFSNGVILVETKSPDARKLIGNDNRVTLTGLLPVSEPVVGASKKASQVPDFRASLYWNPRLILDEDGRATFTFATSDDVGVYTIQLRGITSDGKFFSAEDKIDVNFTK